MMIHENSLIAVGESKQDFLLGDIMTLDDMTPLLDDYVVEYNQRELLGGKLTDFCTVMGPISCISSIWNVELTEDQFSDLRQYAQDEFGYVEGVGNYTKTGCDCARKRWNKTFPEKSVLYVRTTIGSDDFYSSLGKNYGIVVSYRGNKQYNTDYQTDNVLNGIEFGENTYGHVTRAMEKNAREIVLDQYKGRERNEYEMRNGFKALVDSGVFYSNAYIFIADPNSEMYQKHKDYEQEKEEARSRVKEMGISNGEEGDRPVTRDEVFVMLKRYDDLEK